MFRTETEMRFSVLSDNKYPTKAAKYWQSVREQNTHFENLVHLSFDARKNEVEIKKLQRDIKKEKDPLERELKQVELEEKLYGKAQMELVAKHRMREVATWSKLKKEFDDGNFDKRDVNTHQAKSYLLRLQRQKETITPGTSQPEVFNVLGQLEALEKGLRENTLSLDAKKTKKIKMKFDFVYLGQTVLKYQVPLEIFVGLNEIYEKQKKQLPKANKQLVGKIQDEVSLFYSGPNNDKMHQHCFLPQDILKWFHSIFDHYTDWNKIGPTQKSINSIWVNEMKAHEYNPVHIHQGKLYTGLSSVMVLKLPKETGVEYSAEEKPMNGRLQIIGSANGQFSKTDYSPNMKIGDFYVFPYDMRHCVYPFNGTKETRRTLVCNVDVDYNPVSSRTGSGQNE